MVPLGLLADGEAAEIVSVSGAAAPAARAVGLQAGVRVRVLANGGGPVLVKIDGARIAVDRGVAMRITVRT
ncbi:MAG: FeoA family protein [Anaeromyxobacter sp.]